ncbi:MAG: hypothetical protein Q9179_004236, partial [Wetmoreana sp. 5 TL-2023]
TLSVARSLCVAAIPDLVENRGGELVSTVTVMMVFATLAVLLRLYARRISAAKLGPDDYWIFIALVYFSDSDSDGVLLTQRKVLTYGLDINAFYAIKAGIGRHMITLTLDQIESFIKTDQASQVLFGCSITATKLSILYFYHRLFPSRTFFIVSLVTAIASVLWWIGLMLTAFLHCRPLAYYWDRSIPNGHCVNDLLIGYAITSVNIVADLVVLVLPIPWLWGMNMAVPKRMAVVGLFVLGSFVCIAGVVRIPLLSELKLSDITWTSVSVGVWINVECNIGIVSACLPILRPLFSTKYNSSPIARLTRIVRTLTNSHSSSSSGSSSSEDPEKGISSEPNSDSTVVAGNLESGIWGWSRNDSDTTTTTNNNFMKSLPEPAPRPNAARDSEKQRERQRKYRTWYSAAAEILPEIDMSKTIEDGRKVIDVDEIPRYRDDEAKQKGSETKTADDQAHYRSREEQQQPQQCNRRNLPEVGESAQQSQRNSLGVPTRSENESQRSSLGVRRDVWNLMPSIVFWDRTSLIPNINRIR